jgi:hypothetical protein
MHELALPLFSLVGSLDSLYPSLAAPLYSPRDSLQYACVLHQWRWRSMAKFCPWQLAPCAILLSIHDNACGQRHHAKDMEATLVPLLHAQEFDVLSITSMKDKVSFVLHNVPRTSTARPPPSANITGRTSRRPSTMGGLPHSPSMVRHQRCHHGCCLED